MGAAVVRGHCGAVQLISALHHLNLAAWGKGEALSVLASQEELRVVAVLVPGPHSGLTACALG